MLNKRELGTEGEKIASAYLQEQGYKIIQKNFRCKIGEIDIIAMDQEYIVFIEVKYRKNLSHGYPRESVTFHKQKTIYKVAQWYLQKNQCYNISCRFDVLEILGQSPDFQITLLKNAFQCL